MSLGFYSRHYVVPSWRLFDATGKVTILCLFQDISVGKLASGLSRYIQGKHKPNYDPTMINGDFCVVVNARYLQFRGENKWYDKRYFYHSRYPGGLKITQAWKMMQKDPCYVLRRAVYGMLPKNKKRQYNMNFLKIYPGPYHPHQHQFKSIDHLKRENEKLPRLTEKDKKSIPNYIIKDRKFLRHRFRPFVDVTNNTTDSQKALAGSTSDPNVKQPKVVQKTTEYDDAFRFSPRRPHTIDVMRKQQHLLRDAAKKREELDKTA
ncbi:50S ribosomal protein L13 [Reticulomyxa filosa]|uniref:50S ribosomal protein L13 n=1 Tax=Reticulomyxa filosa TaxID=46433 RepID=X6P855_RETFI|nr:50S ribosomal protein L13 [Reticulomyxa filosa]|eukprot:ETO33812.1 50S ribosomal protein L13 [Reticulomyxa filosa]